MDFPIKNCDLPEGNVDLGLTYFVRKGIYSTHVKITSVFPEKKLPLSIWALGSDPAWRPGTKNEAAIDLEKDD